MVIFPQNQRLHVHMKDENFMKAVFGEIIFSVVVLALVLMSMVFLIKPYQVHAQSFVTTSSSNTSLGCVNLTNNLYLGASDRFVGKGNIAKLQLFLIANGYLNANATGFYGPLTVGAVRKFQKDNGITALGLVGPLTRAKIVALTCGTGTTIPPTSMAPTINSISPSAGNVGTTVTVYGSNFDSKTTVFFGPASAGVNNSSSVGSNVRILNSNTLTFTVPERLLPACGYATADRPFVCLIYGPAVEVGDYYVSVKNNVGTSNSLTFRVTSTTSGNNGNSPVINGIDSQSVLGVNQTGTWTVRATDRTGGGLSYRVVWGDEYQYANTSLAANSQGNNFVSSATFTHAYSQAGTYTPRFFVRGQNGLTAEVSATVQVTANQTQSPSITSISPSSGPYGTVVTVYGSGFTRYNNSINYAGHAGVVTGVESVNGTSLQFTIPATPCSSGMFCAQVVLQPGTYQVSVTNQNGTSNSVSYTLTSGGTGSLNQTVNIGMGQTVAISGANNLYIRAVRVVEDSRCPVGVYCIQAGRVVIETNIQSHDMIQVANLAYDGSSSGQSSVVVDGYTVRIIGVTPNARQGGINNWEYTITYQVTK